MQIIRKHHIIPSTVTEMGNGAIRDCYNLREVIFNNGLQKIGDRAFSKCTSLENVKLPSTVTEIGDYAFSRCSSLKEITFNEGLQKIGVEAFIKCKSLQSITLPSTVVKIGTHAFNSWTAKDWGLCIC